ncbi:MAG: hypothetical protein KGZ66_11255 [Selenomonadales bacterium]|nr:hypothetical protein [Selenomonadales bacterium]
MRRFVMWVVLFAALLIVSLVAISVSIARYEAKLEVAAHAFPVGSRGPLYITVRFNAPPSIWRAFVKVQSATLEGTYYESVDAWLTDFDPSIVRMPVPIDGLCDFGEKPAKLPLQGAVPPLNILLEIHPTRTYDGSKTAFTITVYYRILFLRRHITWETLWR